MAAFEPPHVKLKFNQEDVAVPKDPEELNALLAREFVHSPNNSHTRDRLAARIWSILNVVGKDYPEIEWFVDVIVPEGGEHSVDIDFGPKVLQGRGNIVEFDEGANTNTFFDPGFQVSTVGTEYFPTLVRHASTVLYTLRIREGNWS